MNRTMEITNASGLRIIVPGLLLALVVYLAACEGEPPPQFEGGVADLTAVDITADRGPLEDGVVDAPGDGQVTDLGLDMDLTAGADLDASGDSEAGPDLDSAVADLKPDLPGDLGGDSSDSTVLDGGTDSTASTTYKLFGEITSGAAVSTGGTYRLVSQVGHSMETHVLTGGKYTLRLRAVVTIQ